MVMTMPMQEVKRRGLSALNKSLEQGPVWVISNNRPKYVVLFAEDFRRLSHDAFVRDCRDAEAEYAAGLGERTTANDLMAEVMADLDGGE